MPIETIRKVNIVLNRYDGEIKKNAILQKRILTKDSAISAYDSLLVKQTNIISLERQKHQKQTQISNAYKNELKGIKRRRSAERLGFLILVVIIL